MSSYVLTDGRKKTSTSEDKLLNPRVKVADIVSLAKDHIFGKSSSLLLLRSQKMMMMNTSYVILILNAYYY